jgi:hypothetical protein
MDSNKDSSFILRRNKQSGNYSILRKGPVQGTVQRIRYTAYGVFLPYGREEYNDNLIINAVIDDATNINHNLLLTLKKIIKTFEELKDTELGSKYLISGKTFYNVIKEIEGEQKIENNTKVNKKQTKNNNKKSPNEPIIGPEIEQQKIKKYQLRLYLKYGAKVTHAKLIGELTYDQLKGKKCNLDIELGSMWVNNEQYGINIYVTRIIVLN